MVENQCEIMWGCVTVTPVMLWNSIMSGDCPCFSASGLAVATRRCIHDRGQADEADAAEAEEAAETASAEAA